MIDIRVGHVARVAYADPPYIGQAHKHYGSTEVDHEQLIRELTEYDGWALSCSTPSLRQILTYCPEAVRVGAWVKPFCSFKKNVNPAYAWEPVIFVPCRKPQAMQTTRDWISANITLKRGCVGAKPDAFCYWLFQILGLRRGDTFSDLFPGSGAVSRCWQKWSDDAPLLTGVR